MQQASAAPGGKKKQKQPQKSATVLSGKIAPAKKMLQPGTSSAAATAGNRLDSSAPSVRRGKERERPKKKRKTRIKRIILEERTRRREERIRNQELNQELMSKNEVARDQETPVDEKVSWLLLLTSFLFPSLQLSIIAFSRLKSWKKVKRRSLKSLVPSPRRRT